MKTKRKKQYGGELTCNLDETSSSFLILGHGCDMIDEVFTIPNNWVYITSGLCGISTYDSLDFIKLKRDFFNNETYIQNPCLEFEKLNSFFTYNMNIHFSNAPSPTNRTFVNSTFILLTDFFTDDADKIVQEKDAEYWGASKSGVYVNTQNNVKYANSDLVVTLIKNSENEFIITDEQIERIYEGSILPKPQQVIQSMRDTTGKMGKYTVAELRFCMYTFRVTLSRMLEVFSSKRTSGVIFNPLCRSPCDKTVDQTNKYALRRANSLQGMELNKQQHYNPTSNIKNDNDNVDQYLGGKPNKNNKIIKIITRKVKHTLKKRKTKKRKAKAKPTLKKESN